MSLSHEITHSGSRSRKLNGGVTATVMRMQPNDWAHGALFNQMLQKIVGSEAAIYEAHFDSGRFNRVVHALETNLIQAYFLIATWENCGPQTIGGCIQYPTVYTKWNFHKGEFEHFMAQGNEDQAMFPELSQKFRELTGMGAASYLFQERVRAATQRNYEPSELPNGVIARARLGEYSNHIKPMVSILKKYGATLPTEDDDTMLVFAPDAFDPKRFPKTPVAVERLGAATSADRIKHTTLPNVFCVSWFRNGPNGGQRVSATFTRKISTFTGKPAILVQFESNNNLIENGELAQGLTSIIVQGCQFIVDKGWSKINLGRGQPIEIYEPSELLHMQALNEPVIRTVLRKIDATTRMLGNYPMLPVVTDVTDTPEDVLEFKPQHARPLSVMNDPDYSAMKPRAIAYVVTPSRRRAVPERLVIGGPAIA